MVVYLDLVFFFNAVADAGALYVTARLSGLVVRWRRLLAAAVLGGTYGALCTLPPLFPAAALQLAVAAGLVLLAFGREGAFLRRYLLFLTLSCTLGGIMLALARLPAEQGGAAELNGWVCLAAGGACYLVLSVVFRGGARHALRGELTEGRLERSGRSAGFTALLDTGHTLTDPVTGRPVLVAHWQALDPLWSDRERAVLRRLEALGPAGALEILNTLEGGRFRLIPYRAVGVAGGLLLCLRVDQAVIGGETLAGLTVALSPGPVSDGGGYGALWGGNERRENRHAA